MANIAKRRASDIQMIGKLEGEGYKVRIPAAYTYRFEGVLDVFVTTRRWHDLKTGERGSYGNIELFVSEFFDPNAKKARQHNAFLAIRRKRLGLRPVERFSHFFVWALVLAFCLMFLIPFFGAVQGMAYSAKLSEIQEECDQYDDYRLCPLIQDK